MSDATDDGGRGAEQRQSPFEGIDAPLPPGPFEDQLRVVLERLSAADSALDAQIEADRAADRERDEEHARQARAGELGPHWRTVQRQIDAGETTKADVLSGIDTSPAAEAIRATIRSKLAQAREDWAEDESEDAPELEAFAELNESAQRLAAAAAEIDDLIAALQNDPRLADLGPDDWNGRA